MEVFKEIIVCVHTLYEEQQKKRSESRGGGHSFRGHQVTKESFFQSLQFQIKRNVPGGGDIRIILAR